MDSNHRTYRTFICKEAVFRICCDRFDAVTDEIIRQRRILEDYIAEHPEFQRSFVPVKLKNNAPIVACRMAAAAEPVGVGPMAEKMFNTLADMQYGVTRDTMGWIEPV